MATISYAEAKAESIELFHGQRRAAAREKVDETTPADISPDVQRFASQVGGNGPEFVPVVNDEIGLFGYCSDGVHERVRLSGGSIEFGWCIWEWPKILLTAEFHAVWRDPAGRLVDITPKPHNETRIVFVLDRSYSKDFDFDKRPTNKRFRIYRERDVSAAVRTKIAAMQPSQFRYEQARATKAGLPLEDWLHKKQPIDPAPAQIDAFISTCDHLDALLDTVRRPGKFAAPPGYISMMRRKIELQAALQRIHV